MAENLDHSWEERISEASAKIKADWKTLSENKKISPESVSLSELAPQYDRALHAVLDWRHQASQSPEPQLPPNEENIYELYNEVRSIFEERFGGREAGLLYKIIGDPLVESDPNSESFKKAQDLENQIVDLAISYFGSQDKDRIKKEKEVKKWFNNLLSENPYVKDVVKPELIHQEYGFWQEFSKDKPFAKVQKPDLVENTEYNLSTPEVKDSQEPESLTPEQKRAKEIMANFLSPKDEDQKTWSEMQEELTTLLGEYHNGKPNEEEAKRKIEEWTTKMKDKFGIPEQLTV